MQVLGGWSAAKYGGKNVLAFAVAMWSLWTVATPVAARSSVFALVVCRIMLGLGEGLALPALHHVTAQWSPEKERARFVAGVTSGQHLGKALALVCSPLVAVRSRHCAASFLFFAASFDSSFVFFAGLLALNLLSLRGHGRVVARPLDAIRGVVACKFTSNLLLLPLMCTF